MGNHVCCICGKSFYGWGNDPYPVVMDEDKVCCDDCDKSAVLSARIVEIYRNGGN